MKGFKEIELAAFLALVISVFWGQASCEASAYRRLTGKHVTAWDALWLDLRVQEGVKND